VTPTQTNAASAKSDGGPLTDGVKKEKINGKLGQQTAVVAT